VRERCDELSVWRHIASCLGFREWISRALVIWFTGVPALLRSDAANKIRELGCDDYRCAYEYGKVYVDLSNERSRARLLLLPYTFLVRLLHLLLYVREHGPVRLYVRARKHEQTTRPRLDAQHTLYSMLNSPLPCVAPRNALE
jgi:hypothetical protein